MHCVISAGGRTSTKHLLLRSCASDKLCAASSLRSDFWGRCGGGSMGELHSLRAPSAFSNSALFPHHQSRLKNRMTHHLRRQPIPCRQTSHCFRMLPLAPNDRLLAVHAHREHKYVPAPLAPLVFSSAHQPRSRTPPRAHPSRPLLLRSIYAIRLPSMVCSRLPLPRVDRVVADVCTLAAGGPSCLMWSVDHVGNSFGPV